MHLLTPACVYTREGKIRTRSPTANLLELSFFKPLNTFGYVNPSASLSPTYKPCSVFGFSPFVVKLTILDLAYRISAIL